MSQALIWIHALAVIVVIATTSTTVTCILCHPALLFFNGVAQRANST
jgi:hypothetical protein